MVGCSSGCGSRGVHLSMVGQGGRETETEAPPTSVACSDGKILQLCTHVHNTVRALVAVENAPVVIFLSH